MEKNRVLSQSLGLFDDLATKAFASELLQKLPVTSQHVPLHICLSYSQISATLR